MTNQDPRAHPFTAERRIGLFLFLASLALYVASMSWSPFPGLPAQALRLHLGLGGAPSTLDSLWGWLVRLFARLSGLPVAGWAGLFSAACGAAGVGLVGRLMVRVGYRGWKDLTQASMVREAQARELSGLVAGIFLACCIPFWVVSTRSLPGAFHVLLLLGAAWFFSEYQQSGKLRHLGLLGVIYGVGVTEFATAIVFLPLMVFLVARELFRRRTLRAWRPHLVVWGGLLTGLLLYPFNAYVLFRQGAPTGLFSSPWQAWAQILQSQFMLITQVRYTSGGLVILFFSLVPWLMLFVMSRRSPWFYEGDQIVVRLVFIGGLLGMLYNAPFAIWNLLGMGYLMVTPYLLQAVCMGYMAGEFWILGESQALRKGSRAKRLARGTAGLFALLLLLVVLAAGAHNWNAVDGRHGRDMQVAANEILDRLDGRDIVFSTGLLDDILALAVRERKAPVQVVSAPQTPSPRYLQQLAGAFSEEALSGPLQQGDFGAFLDNFLLSDAGPGRTAIIDMPDVFRGFGYLVPDGYIYRLEPHSDAVDLKALVASQRTFWDRMEKMAAHPAPDENLARPHQDQLRLMASKVANNLGVMQAERGDEAGALETFRTARRICPDNLSVLLNLLELGKRRALPEGAELEADWEIRQEKLGGERWVLAVRFGYVWQAREWVRRGRVWVLSGVPTSAEASLRNQAASADTFSGREQLLDQAYLQWGSPFRDESYYRGLLMQNEKNTFALMSLCRLGLRRNDPEAAKAYIAEAMRMGLPEERVLFDRAMAAYVQGHRENAVASLKELTRQMPGDARVWMALVLLTDERDPDNKQAMRALKDHRSADIGVRLALAWVHMSRQQWAEAQAEVELAIQMDSRNPQAWEMMLSVAQARGNQLLMEASLRTLLAEHPEHPFQQLQKAVDHYRRGELAEAEADLRIGLRHGRNPDLLNALAHIIMNRNGELPDALALVDEALRKQPFNPTFRCTKIELNLREGHLDEAERDLHQVLEAMPGHIQALLMSIQLHVIRGEKTEAVDLARTLGRRRNELSPEQRAQLKKWVLQIRKP